MLSLVKNINSILEEDKLILKLYLYCWFYLKQFYESKTQDVCKNVSNSHAQQILIDRIIYFSHVKYHTVSGYINVSNMCSQVVSIYFYKYYKCGSAAIGLYFSILSDFKYFLVKAIFVLRVFFCQGSIRVDYPWKRYDIDYQFIFIIVVFLCDMEHTNWRIAWW